MNAKNIQLQEKEIVKLTINQIYDNHYHVASQSQSNKWYQVKKLLNADVWTCTCFDFSNRLRRNDDDKRCKHILASHRFRISNGDKIDLEKYEKQVCPKCYSNNFKKTGYRTLKSGIKRQRYTCLSCKYRFTLCDNGFRKMKNDPQIIVESLNLIFCGVSYRDIARHIKETRNLRISHTTILSWSRKYMGVIKEYVDSILPPLTSEVWSVDEMMLNVKKTKKTGKGFYDWLWSIIDPKTKFILASEVSKKRDIDNARKILSAGKQRTGTKPNFIITDSLRSYEKAIYREFGLSRVAHIKTHSLSNGFENRPIERFHNELRAVIKSKRGLGNDKSAQEFADSYRVYHNFVRPQGGLPNNQTPAEATGIDLHLGKNKIMSLIQKSTEPEHKFAIHLRHRIDHVKIVNENDCIRVVPKRWIEKRTWREINDILRLYRFCWLKNGKDGCWIRLKQSSLTEFF